MPAFLIPLLLNLAPSVASWVLGDKSGGAVKTVTDIIKQTTGIDGDPDAALAANPQLMLDLKLALLKAQGEEAERRHQEYLAGLADVASAREQTVGLAKAKSPIAWGAPIVSVLAVCVFAGFIYLLFVKAIPESMKDALMLMAGAASAGFTQVLGYWLGSSAGSAQKNGLVEMLTKR